MITKEILLLTFERNLSIIQRQTAGLTHEQCLLQPPFRGNCMNWVLGHILDSRNSVLQALKAEGVLSTEQHQRYGYGSEPVCGDGDDIIKLETLLALLQESQARIRTALENASDELLAEKRAVGPMGMTCEELVLYMLWHETYHTGQTELLRQLAGTDDKVI